MAITNSNYNSVCLATIQTASFERLHEIVEQLKNACVKMSPDFPVEISFMDDAVNHMYESEVQFRRIFSLFAICAIIISSLGILAMSIFAAQRRIKEIGVRKVNGAKVSDLLIMLNKDFVKWVVISFVVAIPIAYYSMQKWLDNFTYKTSMNWWVFALAGLIALTIALISASWQSWKAATMNPVDVLRYE